MFNLKIKPIIFLLTLGSFAQAQTNTPQTLEYPNGPTSQKLEYNNGPTSVLDTKELGDLKDYATSANVSIKRLLTQIKYAEANFTDGQGENSIVSLKKLALDGVNQIIQDSKDKRSTLLLTHALEAGSILVKLIEQQAIEIHQAPQGIVEKQLYILKQSLLFAQEFYVSDYDFIDGVLKNHEQTTNPKFVEFGQRLTQFILEMSNGITNASINYGMIRWSLAVMANYIKADKNTGILYASTEANIITTLLSKNGDNSPIFPDIVDGETAPSDIQCIMKTRNLKFLAQESFQEMESAKAAAIKN